jgi:hypothetical protein
MYAKDDEVKKARDRIIGQYGKVFIALAEAEDEEDDTCDKEQIWDCYD